ncbi:hypothetical protein BDR04DRAFT_1109869 [Suillus decipiens]|nr:hypothetical protein BDR04DRAFT_1109869 [Suillus decipiens]
MANASTAGATATLKTPPHGVDSGSNLKSTPLAEWGYNRIFERKDGSSNEVRFPDEDIGEVDLTFDLKSDKRITHFGLRGRAATVFPVKSKKIPALVPTLPHHNPHNPTGELVAKLYWPEEGRESEAEILKKVYEIVGKDAEGKVKHHIPEMMWYYKSEDTSTPKIRMALGLKDAERSRRALYITIFRKLCPITKLSGPRFLRAWWHIVVCHYALWENNVHHRDVSPSNLMVYKTSDGRYIGVLNDFDLSSTQDSPSGQERTGTIPFMAIELLTKEAIKGEVQHLYRHDAESFIWVLTWVSLRYREGQLLRKCRPLDGWLKADAIGCRKEKNDFLITGRYSSTPSPSHRRSWGVVRSSLKAMDSFYRMKHEADYPETVYADDPEMEDLEADVSEARHHVSYSVTDATVFKTWFEDIIRTKLPAQFLDVRV